MHISLVGINHRTTPVAVREEVAVGVEQLKNCLTLLGHYTPHGLVLSTCNRTEVYTTSDSSRLGVEASIKFLKAHSNMSDVSLLRYVYIYQDETAVKQLFQVACGLDSMIVGEFEVLGQVRQALEAGEEAGMVDLLLRTMFQSAVRAGRRVREKTGISKNALSVSSVAVDLAAGIVDGLKNRKVLIIGAGEAGRLVAKAVKDRGASQIAVASRTRQRASALAEELGGVPISLSNLTQELSTCDIVVTCAGAPRRILDFHRAEAAMKTRPKSPLVIIDIAIPRNVEPAVNQIENVFLYNIDDLTQISDLNRKLREEEIQQVNEIMAAEIDRFTSWWQALEVRPVVSALMSQAEDIRRTQLDRTIKKLPSLTDEERDNLEAMTKSIVTKILQNPIQYLKANANTNGHQSEIVSKLFQLDIEKPE